MPPPDTAAVCVPTSTSGLRLSTLLVLQAEIASMVATSAPLSRAPLEIAARARGRTAARRLGKLGNMDPSTLRPGSSIAANGK